MRIKSFFFAGILFSFLVVSCSLFTKNKETGGGKAEPGQGDSLFFSMERTPCYGRCAVYKLHIFRSGYATFEALRFVEGKEGLYQAKFTKEELKSLTEKIEEIKYFGLADEYNSPVTDLPSVITSVNLKGKKKSIKDRHQAPPELRQLEKFAEDLLNGKDWKKTVENK